MNRWQTCEGPGPAFDASRRALFAAGLAGAVWWWGAKGSLAQAALRPDRSEGPVVVVVFLRGGADGLNIVAPYREDPYYKLRPTLAIARPGDRRKPPSERLLDLDGEFGLNPALSMLLPHFREGRLGFVHACGSGDETRSHFEAMGTMERGAAARPNQLHDGWLARHLGSTPQNRNPMRALALGYVAQDSLLGATEAITLANLEDFRLPGDDQRFTTALRTLYAPGPDAVSAAGRDTIAVMESLRALDPARYAPERGAAYPDTEFGSAMKQVALLVKAKVGLEVAALDLGGWDSHIAQGTTAGWLTNLLQELGGAMDAFLTDLGPESSRVTLVVQTEFGRRIEENSGFGTDHGRGGVMMVAGAGVRGGRVHGRWPTLAPGRTVGPGDLAVTTDYRQVLAEVVEHRLGNPEVARVFPGLEKPGIGVVGPG